MKERLRIGILGCARIAEKYALQALRSISTVDVVAIASRDVGKARSWGEKYALEPETYDSLVARPDINIIYSPLPVGLQEEWAIRAMRAGKHVICEKSITYSLDSTRRMLEASVESGTALYENFVPRFHPQHARIREHVERGDIGKTRVFRASYGFPPFPENDIRYSSPLKGGALNDCGCYTVFMARTMLRAEPVAVTCALVTKGRDVDVAGSALLEFPDAQALVAFGFDHLYQNEYSLWGSNGIVRTRRAFAIPPTLAPPVELVTNNGTSERVTPIEVTASDQFVESFRYVCDAVRAKDTRAFDAMRTEVLAQARVMEAMRASAREWKRIELN
jgi:NDP-hexose-3-ketoreductase